jgi:hypothetical protein
MAIIVHFKDTVRERVPEWISAACLIIWGSLLLSETSILWETQYFNILSSIASQAVWGYTSITVGLFRLISLAINGIWRPTAHLRALGALLGCIIWSGVLISYLGLDWNPPVIASKSAMLALDISALWFCAGDAKLADLRAQELAKSRNLVES